MKILYCFAFIFFITICFANTNKYTLEMPIPNFINYQGKLLENGNLVSRQIVINFRLFDSLNNGQIISESSNLVNVIDGLYSVNIGNDFFIESTKYTTNVYLEIEIDGQILSPRERITSVMSSFKSQYANVSSIVSNPYSIKFYSETNLIGWGRKK